MPICVGGERRHFADQADGLLAPALGVAEVARVRIKGGERGHGADQDAHGVRVVVEAVHELLDVLMGHGVAHDFAVPAIPARRRWAARLQQKVRHFEEAAVLGELFDGVAAVAQNALVAIQVGDGAVQEAVFMKAGS